MTRWALLTALALFVLAAAPAQAYAPAAWPADTQWVTYTMANGSAIRDDTNEINPAATDVSGLGGSSVYIAKTGTGANAVAFFRLRLREDPRDKQRPTELVNYAWMVEIADANNNIVLYAGANGLNDNLWLAATDGGAKTIVDYGGLFVEPAGATVPYPVRVKASGADYFIDWQVPISLMTTVSLNSAVTESANLKFYYGTSANNSNINKDYMIAGASSVVFTDVAPTTLDVIGNSGGGPAVLDLSKTFTGPNPPQWGRNNSYILTLTARNTGGTPITSLSVTDDIDTATFTINSATANRIGDSIATGTPTNGTTRVTWSIPTLLPGAATTATINLSVSPLSAAFGSRLRLNPGIIGSGTDSINNVPVTDDTTDQPIDLDPITDPRPDLLIRNNAGTDPYELDGTYQDTPAGSQLRAQSVDPGVAGSYQVQVQNDGTVAQAYVIKATGATGGGWTYTYKVGATDITSAITSGTGYTTASLAASGSAGNSIVIDVTATPDGTVSGGATSSTTINAYLDADDCTANRVRDAVKATTTCNTANRPDLMISKDGTNYTGTDVYNPTDPTAQSEAQSVAPTTTATYQVKLKNSGNTAFAYVLKASGGSGGGWTVTYKIGATDITTDILGTTGYTLPSALAAGAETIVTVTVTPDGTVAENATKTFSVIAYKDAGGTIAGDSVQGVTTSSIVKRPDLMISTDGTNYTGADVYDAANPATQSAAQSTTQPASATYQVKLKNNGDGPFAYVLKATGATGGGWVVSYTAGVTDITSAILSGAGHTLPTPLAVGAETIITVTVTPDATVASGNTKTFSIVAYKDAGATDAGDSVQGVTTAGTFLLPDLAISTDGTTYTGTGVYDPADPSTQSAAQTTTQPTAATYQVKLKNNGNTSFAYVLKASGASGGGWTVTYKIGATDITSAILNGTGYTLPSALAVGAETVITVTVTPDATVAAGATKTFSITVYKDAGGTVAGDSVQGNTTAGAFTYPDLTISADGANYTGADVYDPADPSTQSAAQSVAPTVTATYQVKLKNNGNTSFAYVLKASGASGGGWTVTYKIGATDITTDILSGTGYTLPSALAVGDETTITVTVTPDGTVANGATKTFSVVAYKDAGATIAGDSVQGVTTLTIITQPDLLIKLGSQADGSYALDGVYQTTPSGEQSVSNTVPAADSTLYHIRLENDGNTTRTFCLKAVESAEVDWTITYLVGAADISSAIRGSGGYTTAALAPGASLFIAVQVSASGTVGAGTSKVVTVSVYHDGTDTTVRDVVRATTTVTGGPHLEVTKAAALRDSAGQVPDPGRTTGTVGDRILYTVSLTNTGSGAATAIVATDVLPSGVALRVGSETATLPAGVTVATAYSSDGGATWTHTPTADGQGLDTDVKAIRWTFTGNLSAVAPDNAIAVGFQVTVVPGLQAPAWALNSVSVDYQDTIGNPQARKIASASTYLAPRAVALEPNRSVASVPGAILFFAHTLTNRGPAPDTYRFSYSMNQGWLVTLYRDLNGNGALDNGEPLLPDANGDGILDSDLTIEAGGQIALLARVAIPASAASNATGTVALEARSRTDSGQYASATDSIALGSRPVLSVTKYIQTPGVTNSSAPPGTAVTYGLVCTNTGTADATEVVLMDTLPPFTRYVSGSAKLNGVAVTPDPFNATTRMITVPLGSLAPGASATVTFRAVVE